MSALLGVHGSPIHDADAPPDLLSGIGLLMAHAKAAGAVVRAEGSARP